MHILFYSFFFPVLLTWRKITRSSVNTCLYTSFHACTNFHDVLWYNKLRAHSLCYFSILQRSTNPLNLFTTCWEFFSSSSLACSQERRHPILMIWRELSITPWKLHSKPEIFRKVLKWSHGFTVDTVLKWYLS